MNFHPEVAEALDQALAEGKARPYAPSSKADLAAWGYEEGECHTNAADYADRHGASVVQGWLKHRAFHWAKHSIIKTASGRHLDVTLRASTGPQFVPHTCVENLCDLSFVDMPAEINNFPVGLAEVLSAPLEK